MVTGANGFIGRALADRLLAEGTIGGQPISTLILLDQELADAPDDGRVLRHIGSVTNTALLRRILADGVGAVFHHDFSEIYPCKTPRSYRRTCRRFIRC